MDLQILLELSLAVPNLLSFNLPAPSVKLQEAAKPKPGAAHSAFDPEVKQSAPRDLLSAVSTPPALLAAAAYLHTIATIYNQQSHSSSSEA